MERQPFTVTIHIDKQGKSAMKPQLLSTQSEMVSVNTDSDSQLQFSGTAGVEVITRTELVDVTSALDR